MRNHWTILIPLLLLATCASSPDGGDLTSVELARPVHFEAVDGGDLVVPAGRYSVTSGEGATVDLLAGGGDAVYRVRAEVETHEQVLRSEVALSLAEGDDTLCVHLLRPDRIELEAAGSHSGVRSRGWSRKRLPRPRVRQATSAKAGRTVRVVSPTKSGSHAKVAARQAQDAVKAAHRAAQYAERAARLVKGNRRLQIATRAAAGTARREATAAQRAATLAEGTALQSLITVQLAQESARSRVRSPGNDQANMAAIQRAAESAKATEEKELEAAKAAMRGQLQPGRVRLLAKAAKEITEESAIAAKEAIRDFHEAVRAQAEGRKKQAQELRNRAHTRAEQFLRPVVTGAIRWAASAASLAAQAAARAAAAAEAAAEAAQQAAQQAAEAAQDAAEAAAAAAQAAAAAAQAAAASAAQAAQDAAEAVEDWVNSWF